MIKKSWKEVKENASTDEIEEETVVENIAEGEREVEG